MVDLCRRAKHATVHPEKPSFICLKLRGKEKIELMTEWCWAGYLKNPAEKSENAMLWRLIPASASSLPGVPGKGWGRDGVFDKNGGDQVYVSAETCEGILVILSCLDCFLKAWMYMVFRAGSMHVCMRTAGLRHPAKTGWRKKKAPGGSRMVCLQICSVYLFSLGVNIHSSLLAIKAHFNSPMELPNVFLDY